MQKEPAFARIKGRQAVHIVVDGETLCGGDLIDGHEKFKAKKWYKTQSNDDLPRDAHLCRACDAAYGDGVAMSSIELANAIREEIGVEPSDKQLKKAELAEVYRQLLDGGSSD